MDDDGNVKGLFKDTLEIATRNLNLTLKMQKTLPKNENKWFIKYVRLNNKGSYSNQNSLLLKIWQQYIWRHVGRSL